MSEEAKIVEYNGDGNGRDGERVLEWEDGLPGLDDLTPLSQSLIPLELLTAFSITAEPPRTLVDVNRASKNTINSIIGRLSNNNNYNNNNNFKSFAEENPIDVDNEETQIDLNLDGLDARKLRRIDVEECDSQNNINSYNNNYNNNQNYNTSVTNMSVSNDDVGSSKSSKRARLVWTPQLHKRFVEVVAHLGIKNAVPKTIMQLMNVEGLTRENVASHLQKYRLYLKRMQGLSDEGPSASDHLFASTPVPRSLREAEHGHGNGHEEKQLSNGNGKIGMPIHMNYPPPPPQMMHMPYIGMMGHGHGYHGYEAHHQYDMMKNKFGSFMQYHNNHVAPNDN